MASPSGGSSTSSAFFRRPASYDVFISFRGVDTRTTFVEQLYDALRKAGIYAFIDREELWEGDDIRPGLLRAIQGSEISIPVISKNYANSKYCLLELAEICECHRRPSDAQTVLPIFIGVEPEDVQNPNGSFQAPFQEHQNNNDSAIVQSWKNALTEVGKLERWTLKGGTTIQEQSNLIKLVVRRVLSDLKSIPLDECRHPVGIDFHVGELSSLLNVGSDDVRFLSICGMAGIGKTTMAKSLYNRIFRSFNGSSFLIGVREEASQGNKGLVSLQKQLLNEIFRMDDNCISNVSEGSKLIEKRLCKEKILLILDDVDDHKQLDALAGRLNWFGQGSRVIITTRDEHILNVHKVGKDITVYKPAVLNLENSLELFSLYAFSKNEPPEDYKNFSLEAVRQAKGLPRTLEKLALFLNDKEKDEWEDALEELEDTLDGE